MSDISIRDTIIPKSDQLNADDLLTCKTMTISITTVKVVKGEQPVIINYSGDNGRPYKPNKTMRKIIVTMWGDNSDEWAGRILRLRHEPTVKWAGEEVGGIEISGMSHIQGDCNLSLPVRRGQKKTYHISKIIPQAAATDLVEKYRKRLDAVAVESGEAAVAEAWAKTPEPVRMALGGPFLESLVEGARAAEVERNAAVTVDPAPAADDADDPF